MSMKDFIRWRSNEFMEKETSESTETWKDNSKWIRVSKWVSYRRD